VGKELQSGDQSGSRLLFVVQKHKATSLHYDFRLEILGRMSSWAIPKGPSQDNKVRRLAMPTGDHSLEYRNFEGVIPSGNFGAGPVMVWDNGTYDPETEYEKGMRQVISDRKLAEDCVSKSFKDGNLKFFLYGKKLRGSFALVRTSGLKGKESWLMIKHKDKFVVDGYEASAFDFSAVSNRSMKEIQAEGNPGNRSLADDGLPDAL
jgi:bifunctional non-homologous end joining protein LigD